jgi:hypothetical protein
VAHAIHFGMAMAAKGEFAIHDVFLVESNPKLQAAISVSTAFERLAVYASQQTHRGASVDPAFVDTVNHNPIFETHYALDITSPHKLLSIARFWPGPLEQMEVAEHRQLGPNSGNQGQQLRFLGGHRGPGVGKRARTSDVYGY